jgi:hypothetical protein
LLSLSTETLLSSLPVEDFPDGLEVLGLAVLVLEAVDKSISFVVSFGGVQGVGAY